MTDLPAVLLLIIFGSLCGLIWEAFAFWDSLRRPWRIEDLFEEDGLLLRKKR